uniref:Uncharacterized protein n=1 Tax=Heterorhabditis bacteriophora TaxID=37862 RepID=A0A1I7X239_HETBA
MLHKRSNIVRSRKKMCLQLTQGHKNERLHRTRYSMIGEKKFSLDDSDGCHSY